MQSVKWKEIEGYEGKYLVSDTGKVFSIRANKTLTPSQTEKGYLRVCLQDKGEKRWLRVHRIVASAFIANHDSKETVNHINGNRKDNRVENLEWATMEEQNRDPRRNAKMSESMKRCKYICDKMRKVAQIGPDGNVIQTYESLQDAARALGSTASNIRGCCIGERHTCKGYTFKFA